MSEEVRINKRRRSESEEPQEETGNGVSADVVGTGALPTEALDGGRGPENVPGEEADDAGDHAAAAAAAAAAAVAAAAVTVDTPAVAAVVVEQPKMPPMQTATMQLPVQMTHHQPRIEEKPVVENFYKPEHQTLDASEYKVPTTMGPGAVMGGIPGAGVTAGGMGNALQGLGGMTGLAQFAGVPGMGLGVGGVDLNQQILAAQQRQYEMNAALVKAQMNSNAAAAAAAAARAQPKPAAPPSRKSAPSSYEPPVQLTASGRPARARRVNYAELAGALDDEEEDDQANLVPNWARRRRKTSDQDRDYGVGVGGGARASNVQMSGAGANQAMYGVAGAGGYNAAPRAAAPAAGVNLYGLGAQGAAGLRGAVGGAAGAGLQAANLAGIAGNAALAGQAGWQNQVVWGQNPAMGGYGALQSLAAAQRPQVAAQQFLLPGAARGVAPNLMQDMQLMLSRGADGQGGMPGAGQQR